MITAELYSELKKITAEEARILNGDTKIETAIYMSPVSYTHLTLPTKLEV